MADFVMVPESDWQDILDATREKTGGTEKLLSGEVAPAVRSIEGETIIRDAYSEYDDVCFWDYDGTLLYSCTLEEAQTMTKLPKAPDHSGHDVPLTFVEWNWTLEDLHNLTTKADVGAIYKPTDNKTHFSFRITPTSGLNVTVAWYNRSAIATLTLDWGDGSSEDYTHGGNGDVTITHTYSDYGTYHCSIDPHGEKWNPGNSKGFIRDGIGATILVGDLILDSCVTWEWPGAQGTACFSGANISNCILPYNMENITGNSLLAKCVGLKHLNIPRSLTSSGFGFQACRNMRRVSIPAGITEAGDYGFSGLYCMEEIRLPEKALFMGEATSTAQRFLFTEDYALKRVTLPKGHITLHMREFRYCYSLRSLIIPETVTEIGSNALAYTGIIDFYFYSIVPPTLTTTDAFDGTDKGAIIHVPAASLEAYKTATNWTAWADYMVGDL